MPWMSSATNTIAGPMIKPAIFNCANSLAVSLPVELALAKFLK